MTVAVKVIPKRILKGNIQLVESETNAVKELVHPNIVRLYDNFESKVCSVRQPSRVWGRI